MTTVGNQVSSPGGASEADVNLSCLVQNLPYGEDELFVVSHSTRTTLGQLRRHVSDLTDALRTAGVDQGLAVATVVEEGIPALVSMLATWAAGGVYVPVNGRFTGDEVNSLLAETPVGLLVGSPTAIAGFAPGTGVLEVDPTTLRSTVVRPADATKPRYDADVALALRTSGTTGRPKAVLLRHSGTLGALDSSLRKIRRRADGGRNQQRRLRLNMIPTSLALWAGIYNTLFSLRAEFGVILLDKFSVDAFVSAVHEFDIRSTVLAPAMISMLADADGVESLGPLDLVRSITAPLSPEIARRFYNKFGVFVLNSYGQTELGGEVVGWTKADIKDFGESKLGSAGRPYDDVELRICDPDGIPLDTGQFGEIFVNSPFRMRGYAAMSGSGGQTGAVDDSRLIDGFLRTGDLGRIDKDGFVWIQGRASDMINRGGLKIFPDEVEEVLRRHPLIRDAGVAAVSDDRLGEVPYAWVVADDDRALNELQRWCRKHLVAYKVPIGFTRVAELPRNEIGKVLRRELSPNYPSL